MLQKLKYVNGILVPGGFGERGIEGKMKAIQFAREQGIVFFGICLGMQLAILEFCRNVLGIKEANSMEFNPNTHEAVIYLIENFINQSGEKQIRTHTSPMGGTMRLGEYECTLKEGSKLQKAYKNQKLIKERHRHRYEANPKYQAMLEKKGIMISGKCNGLIEAIELKNHPWFVAVQFHPEFTSRLQAPNLAILEFIKQALYAKSYK